MWQNYVNALLGVCVFVAGFMDLTGSTLQWTFGLLGAAILVIGVWGGVANAPASSSESEHKHA